MGKSLLADSPLGRPLKGSIPSLLIRTSVLGSARVPSFTSFGSVYLLAKGLFPFFNQLTIKLLLLFRGLHLRHLYHNLTFHRHSIVPIRITTSRSSTRLIIRIRFKDQDRCYGPLVLHLIRLIRVNFKDRRRTFTKDQPFQFLLLKFLCSNHLGLFSNVRLIDHMRTQRILKGDLTRDRDLNTFNRRSNKLKDPRTIQRLLTGHLIVTNTTMFIRRHSYNRRPVTAFRSRFYHDKVTFTRPCIVPSAVLTTPRNLKFNRLLPIVINNATNGRARAISNNLGHPLHFPCVSLLTILPLLSLILPSSRMSLATRQIGANALTLIGRRNGIHVQHVLSARILRNNGLHIQPPLLLLNRNGVIRRSNSLSSIRSSSA